MGDAQVGKLFVKVVPEADNFQHETDALFRRLGERWEAELSSALRGAHRRAAGDAAGFAEKAAAAATRDAAKAAQASAAAVEREVGKTVRRTAKTAADAAAQAAQGAVVQRPAKASEEQRAAYQAYLAQREQLAAVAAAVSDVRRAEAAADAERVAHARRWRATNEAMYASMFDRIEQVRQVAAAEREMALGWKRQQEGIREAGRVAADVGRDGGLFGSLFGRTGRAGNDVDTELQRVSKSLAFVGGGPLRGVASTLGLMGGAAATAGGAVAALGAALVAAGVAAATIGVGTYAYSKFAGAALDAAGALEQQQAAFKTLLGSAELGEKMLARVARFAVETPFSTEDVATGAKRLMAYGFAAEDVIPILTDLGNAAGALGLDGGGLNRLITAFGQIRTTGKLQGDEARQLAENGIPVWEMLAKKMGLTTREVMELSSQGLVPAELALTALREGMAESFGGGMQAQVNTFTGSMEKLRDSMRTGLGLSLLPTLPVLSSQLGRIGDVLLPATSALGKSLGVSLATAFRSTSPAVESFIQSFSGLFSTVLAEWTPTMSALTNSLANGFAAAQPGLVMFSSTFSDLVGWIVPQFAQVPELFNKIVANYQTMMGLPGFGELFVGVDRFVAYLSLLADGFGLLATAAAKAMSYVATVWAPIVDAAAEFYGILSKIPGLGFLGGVSEQLDGVASNLRGVAEAADGVAQKSRLDVKVRADISTAESSLSSIAAALATLPREVLARYRIDPTSVAQFDSQAINNLLGVPPEVLATVGLDQPTLAATVAAIREVLDPLSEPVKATINADAAGAIAGAEAASRALKNPSLADRLVKITGDEDGVISAASNASRVLSAVQSTQPVLITASTSQVEAKAAAATAILNAVRQHTPAPIDASPERVALAAATGQALIDAVRQNAPALIGADASPTAAEAAAANLLLQSVQQNAPAPIRADPSPAQRAAGLAHDSINAVERRTPVLIDAEPAPALAKASLVAKTVQGLPDRQVNIGVNDSASGPIFGIRNLLGSIPREVNVTVRVGTSVSGGARVAGVGVGPNSAYPGGVAPQQAGAAPAAAAAAGVWSPSLSALLVSLRQFYRLAASTVREGLEKVFAAEYAGYRRLEVQRVEFSRMQDYAMEVRRTQLESELAGLSGDVLDRRRVANERALRQYQNQLDDERRMFEWSLEDQRRYYDQQRSMAEQMVTQLEASQTKLKQTVSWEDFLSPQALTKKLQQTTAVLQKFSGNMARLRDAGLSDQARAALGEMDPLKAARLVEKLLADPAAIRVLNEAYGAFLRAGVEGSAAFVTPRQVGGALFTPPRQPAAAVAGQQVTVHMNVQPSQPMDERRLAAAIGSELLWRVS